MAGRKLGSEQPKLFWAAHLGGWLAWGLLFKYMVTVIALPETPPRYFTYVTTITVIAILLTAALSFAFSYLLRRPIWLQAAGYLAGTAAAGWLWIHARRFIYGTWFENAKDMTDWSDKFGAAAEIYQKISFMEFFLSAWALMLAWGALYFAVNYYRVFQDVQKSALKSAAMAHEAQLKMLRYQLNPHFLFNTLNAISTLVLEQQTEAANRMVTRLSSFLRYSLDNDPMQKITLEQELAALKLYLDIEKVRFEDRLRLELDVSEQASSALIPSLLLQPLVENAIKFGIARAEDGGTLKIAAQVFAGDLLIELSDDGPGVQLVNGRIPDANGVGLRNTQDRLRELYGIDHSFRLSETEPHGLTIRIRIPFEAGLK
jgi:two-component system LytT family sensor kinase